MLPCGIVCGNGTPFSATCSPFEPTLSGVLNAHHFLHLHCPCYCFALLHCGRACIGPVQLSSAPRWRTHRQRTGDEETRTERQTDRQTDIATQYIAVGSSPTGPELSLQLQANKVYRAALSFLCCARDLPSSGPIRRPQMGLGLHRRGLSPCGTTQGLVVAKPGRSAT